MWIRLLCLHRTVKSTYHDILKFQLRPPARPDDRHGPPSAGRKSAERNTSHSRRPAFNGQCSGGSSDLKLAAAHSAEQLSLAADDEHSWLLRRGKLSVCGLLQWLMFRIQLQVRNRIRVGLNTGKCGQVSKMSMMSLETQLPILLTEQRSVHPDLDELYGRIQIAASNKYVGSLLCCILIFNFF
jgi:hypothetical protein